jgi:hypothetical protein
MRRRRCVGRRRARDRRDAEHGPDAPLPEDTLWDTIFDEQCSADADFVLFPTAESWELGDRLVVCVLTS